MTAVVVEECTRVAPDSRVGGDTVGGDGLVNSITFLGEGCGVITPGGGEISFVVVVLSLVVVLFRFVLGLESVEVEEEDSTLVEQTGCREENIKLKGSELYVGSSLTGTSFSLLVFDLSNASKSFCEVNVVILCSMGVEGGVSSTEKSVGGSTTSCPWKQPFTHFWRSVTGDSPSLKRSRISLKVGESRVRITLGLGTPGGPLSVRSSAVFSKSPTASSSFVLEPSFSEIK